MSFFSAAILLFAGLANAEDLSATYVYQPGDGGDYSGIEQSILMEEYSSSQFENGYYGRVRRDGSTGKENRTILRWPNIIGTNDGQIPAYANILSAKVKIKGQYYATGQTVYAYQVIEKPNQAGTSAVTWTKRDTNTDWTVAGCGYVSSTEASRSNVLLGSDVYDSYEGWVEIDITDAVQEWTTNLFENNGVILVGDYSSGDYGLSFRGVTDSTQSYRPKLIVTWEPGVTPDTTPTGPVANLHFNNGDEEVALDWQNPADEDLYQVVILSRNGGAVSATPTDGLSVFLAKIHVS